MHEPIRDFKRLDQRDQVLWWSSVVVMMLLTVAVVVVSLPALLNDPDSFFRLNLNQATRGLVGVVLLFNIYTVYQHHVIRRLQSQSVRQMSIMAQMEAQSQKLYEQAVLDPLTGISNRRAAEERLTLEMARSRRMNHPLTVLLLDLDNFKEINDRLGHPVGDAVLVEFANRLKKTIRTSDLAARIGGDEFLLILTECNSTQAPMLLKRLGASVEVNVRGEQLQVRYSAGWASFQAGQGSAQLIEEADRALYQQKRDKGRPLAAAL